MQPKSVTINDNEEVLVSGNAQENFFTEEPEPVNDSVFKCPGCTLLTIHQGFEFQALHVDGGITHIRRLYMCTNCGKFATK